MAQIFHRSTNTLSKLSLFGLVFVVFGGLWLILVIQRSAYTTQADVAREQPVPFSHKHHVSGLGIDCRYCHTSVEVSSFAGVPPTATCMNCHSQIWARSTMLEPVRESYRTGRSIEWNRVNRLADFTYFNHSIHVNKGVGCSTCHGPVHEMPLTWRSVSLSMEWCLDCHRAPEKYLRPKSAVFDPGWEPPADQLAVGAKLLEQYEINTADNRLTNCSICHR